MPGPLLETVELKKRFGGVHAVDGISLSLGAGELRCIIGPNGAGKSTFFQLLTGRVRPDSGRIFYAGRDITREHPFQRARHGIAVKVQSLGVYPELTVQHNLSVPLQRHVSESQLPAAISALLPRLGLAGREQSVVRDLSHGQRQWLEISMLIVADPKLLLVDEPAAGLTDKETELTAQLLLELKGHHTLIVIEHDMDFVRRLNSRVTVLDNGKVLADGSLDQVQEDPAVIEAYLGR